LVFINTSFTVASLLMSLLIIALAGLLVVIGTILPLTLLLPMTRAESPQHPWRALWARYRAGGWRGWSLWVVEFVAWIRAGGLVILGGTSAFQWLFPYPGLAALTVGLLYVGVAAGEPGGPPITALATSGGQGKARFTKNEQKAYAKIAALRAEEARHREDWQHKVGWEIANTCRAAAFADLDIENMTSSAAGTVDEPGRNVRQKAGLNRVILNEASCSIAQATPRTLRWSKIRPQSPSVREGSRPFFVQRRTALTVRRLLLFDVIPDDLKWSHASRHDTV